MPDLPDDVKASSLRFANFFYGNANDLDPVYVACVVGTGFKGHLSCVYLLRSSFFRS